ncbi:calpain-13-like [Maylandia zebra]|uniref:calpain-13-like n=1 Tax=Maylandia zebra TaxID=106582 RepID=UPI00403C838E
MPPPGACLNIMEARHKQMGYGSISNPEKFFNQDFKNLKQYCLTKGVRYLDDMFPPDAKSVGQGILMPSDLAHVKWLRPAQIAPDAEFVVDGVSRFDFGQGVLGNCWFLASIGALTFQNHIFEQVVPLDQKIKENYCGIFHFRFWRFGRWVDVVIDDKLPTINGRLIFVHSKDPNEFWPALLEKAYAKVCGSYTDMTSGTPSEAVMDFTGGVHMCVQLSDASSDVWGLICRAGKSNTLMSCGTPQGETSANTVLPNGLVQGHAYTVTGVKELISQGKVVKLIRLWNPWGKGEWEGDWSDCENSNSNEQRYEPVEKVTKVKNHQDEENKKTFFRQYSDKYEEVDAEQLQRLLNENILKGEMKSGGFSLDACRSMVALIDTSITGKLNSEEFVRLWNKVTKYKETFFLTDVSKTGTLSLSELRNAFVASGMKVSDDMLSLMALRYGASSGHMALECFINLMIRLDCMKKIFKQLSDGKSINLKESEWMYVSMYT